MGACFNRRTIPVHLLVIGELDDLESALTHLAVAQTHRREHVTTQRIYDHRGVAGDRAIHKLARAVR